MQNCTLKNICTCFDIISAIKSNVVHDPNVSGIAGVELDSL